MCTYRYLLISVCLSIHSFIFLPLLNTCSSTLCSPYTINCLTRNFSSGRINPLIKIISGSVFLESRWQTLRNVSCFVVRKSSYQIRNFPRNWLIRSEEHRNSVFAITVSIRKSDIKRLLTCQLEICWPSFENFKEFLTSLFEIKKDILQHCDQMNVSDVLLKYM